VSKGTTASPQQDEITLTRQQQEVVQFRPDGDLLVKGIPGSGKTLTIVARAAKLASMPLLAPEVGVPLVRVFSFNKLLSEWIRFLSSQLGEAAPEVTTFDSWAYRCLNQLKASDGVEFDDYARVLIAAAKKHGGLPRAYLAHHVLVDEGQDLTAEELRIVKASALTSFTIAADKAQNIYATGFTWKSVGIKVQGRSRSLDTAMRGTRQIAALAADLAHNDPGLDPDDIIANVERLRDGPMPEIFVCRAFEGESRAIRETVRLAQGENRFGTIAILHPHKKAVYALAHEFGGRVLEPKKPDMVSPGIIVSTIHKVKGLEFDTVIIKGVNDGLLPARDRPGQAAGEGPLSGEYARRLLYVAITRAKRRLVIVTGARPSPLIEELARGHYRRVDY
jgi:superfamily I DNA/RNA helicase